MEKTKEQRYEDLVNAVAGGELAMVKFLWNVISEMDELVKKTPQGIIEKRAKEVDEILKKLKENPPKDGKTPTTDEIVKLLVPLIPPAKKGEDGKTPTRKELLALIEPLIPELPKLLEGKPGKPGAKGETGPMPKHEWNGTLIRFEIGPDEWGEWKNLQGMPGVSMSEGPMRGGMYTVAGPGFKREGVYDLYFGENLTLTRTANGVRIDAEDGGSSGSGGSLSFETPTGTIDDSNVTFTVVNTPLYLVVNGAQYFENVHYTLAGLTITLSNPIGTGGFIRSAYGSGISVETPSGTVDDSNVTFTVANEPKYIVVNGAQYFDGAGYTYLAGTITLDNPVGTGGFIRSVY